MIHSITVLTLWVAMLSIALAYIDYKKIIADVIISKEDKVKRGGIVLMINLAMAFILYSVYEANIIIIAVYSQVMYWASFDMSLNLFRGKSIFYTSNNNRDDNDSAFDKAFNWIPYPYSGIAQLLFKIILLTLCVINLL
jgi:hypothetical protein